MSLSVQHPLRTFARLIAFVASVPLQLTEKSHLVKQNHLIHFQYRPFRSMDQFEEQQYLLPRLEMIAENFDWEWLNLLMLFQ